MKVRSLNNTKKQSLGKTQLTSSFCKKTYSSILSYILDFFYLLNFIHKNLANNLPYELYIPIVKIIFVNF